MKKLICFFLLMNMSAFSFAIKGNGRRFVGTLDNASAIKAPKNSDKPVKDKHLQGHKGRTPRQKEER
jgi:hypothetical protein